jgi:uncharacterized protein (DUF433 family)
MRVTVGMIVESIAAGRKVEELLADFSQDATLASPVDRASPSN